MKVAFVINPNAGKGNCARMWPQVEAAARLHFGQDIQVFRTSARGDGMRCAMQAVDSGAQLIVSVGGDGTHNEVINGLMQAREPRAFEFAILSAGTGGDFRKTLELDADPHRALLQLREGRTVALDVGRIRYVDLDDHPAERYFLNISSVGVGGLADKYANASSNLLGGKATYLISSLRATLQYKNQPVVILADGREVYRGPLFVAAVCNGKFFGGGMRIAPDANPCDGSFSLVILQDFTWPDKIRMTQDVYAGAHVRHPRVSVHSCRVVEVQTDSREVGIDLDGEYPGRMPGVFTVVPGALRMRVPRGAPL